MSSAKVNEPADLLQSRGYFDRLLSQQLDALALEDDDDDDPFDPMNFSDLLNSKGELTGASEGTDSEHEEITTKHQPKQVGVPAAKLTEKKLPLRRDAKYESYVSNVPSSRSTVSKHLAYCQGIFVGDGTGGGPSRVISHGGDYPSKTDQAVYRISTDSHHTPTTETEDENPGKDKDSLEFMLNNSHFPEHDGAARKVSSAVVVFEPEVMKSASWICGSKKNDSKGCGALVQGFLYSSSNLADPTTKYYAGENRASPAARMENLAQLGRLWHEIQDTKQKLEQDINLLANPETPTAISSPKQHPYQDFKDKQPGANTSSLVENSEKVQLPRRNFSIGKRAYSPSGQHKFVESPPRGVGGGDCADLDSTFTSETHVRPRRTVRSKGKVQRNRREHLRNGGVAAFSQAVVPFPFMAKGSNSDEELALDPALVDEILDETDLQDSDLDEILSEISGHIPDVGGNGVKNFFKQSSQTQIPQFGRTSTPEVFKQKYYEERYRRDHCENEISKLQRQLLEFTEKAAVFDAILRGKDSTLGKLAKAKDHLQNQLKSQAKTQNEKIQEIEHLKSEMAKAKEKVASYKDELGRSSQLCEEMKVKVQEIVVSLEQERSAFEEEKNRLSQKVESLQIVVATAQAEKASSLRALHDCQESLETTKKILKVTSDELELIKADNRIQEENRCTLESLNNKLNAEKQLMETEKGGLTRRITALEGEALKMKSDKTLLDTDFRRKLTEEREKLHEYYNTKIKEILFKESEKMMEAEKEFVTLHEEKLERMEVEKRDRLEKMRAKYSIQLQQIKQKFDTQVNLLKKENDEKSKLIGTISTQLRHFSDRDRGDHEMEPGKKKEPDDLVTSSHQLGSHASLFDQEF